MYLQASEATRARIDLLACCNPSGKAGHSLARDQQNEHLIGDCKRVLKGMNSQLRDLQVEKAILGHNILNIIESHDRQSMNLAEEGGRSSHR